jgi:macrolide-specific efflux system membrane fusion protein
VAFLLFGGCFALPVEEPVLPPPVIQPFTPAAHTTVTLTRGTLTRSRSLSVNIVPAVEFVLNFEVPDVLIHSINVEVGDEVNAGDIVAELDREAFIQAIYNAERDVSAALIQISHLEDSQPINQLEAVIRGNAIDENILAEDRGGLQTELAARQLVTRFLHDEDELRVLRSPIDGTITQTLTFREGDTSSRDIRVVTVADETRSIFSVTGWETRYLVPGDIHTVTVNQEPFDAIVIDPVEFGITRFEDNQAFLTVYGGDVYTFAGRVFASLILVLEEAPDVISVPLAAINNVDGREFVYVLEDGLRVVRDITTGMEGNAGVEVVTGLQEGEVVVIG